MKNEGKHTPGPWAYRRNILKDSRNRFHFANDAESPIFTVLCGRPEAEANARLIAAAPDLLAALSELAGVREGRCDSCGCEIAREGYCGCGAEDTFEYNSLCRARVAIVKAGGGNEA